MHSTPNFAVLEGESRHESSDNNNKQPCSCQISRLRNLLFHLVQRISLHFKSPDLYLFCTTKVFPKFLLPFQSQASFQSEQFGSYDYAARPLSLVACSLSSQRSRMLMQKRSLFGAGVPRFWPQREEPRIPKRQKKNVLTVHVLFHTFDLNVGKAEMRFVVPGFRNIGISLHITAEEL